MNKFIIDEKEFEVESSNFENEFVVKSHPKNYKVNFKKFSNDFNDNDILLIDKNVKEKYNIQQVIISGSDQSGEGEHKLFDFLRKNDFKQDNNYFKNISNEINNSIKV